MKRILVFMLTLVLLAGLAVPAMATFPETGEEAESKFILETTMDGYSNLVAPEEPLPLYTQTWDDNEPIEHFLTLEQCRVISSDTRFTVSIVGKDDDFYTYFEVYEFIKQEDGRYVYCDSSSNGCSLRENGTFLNNMIGEWNGDTSLAEKRIYSGESVTFYGSDLKNADDLMQDKPDARESVFVLRIWQAYPSEEQAWVFTRFFLMDDARAEEIVNESKSEEKPTETQESPSIDNPFTDVPDDAYYHDAVLWALEKGVTTGITETTFGPDATCTRGQVATFLWRSMGCPEPATKVNPFTDVKESDYYYKAVLWAYENGITTGATATTFDPAGTCTSAHVITFLWRANGKPAAQTSGTEYYAEAVAWANANDLLSLSKEPFSPTKLSPRADIVTYLYLNAN